MDPTLAITAGIGLPELVHAEVSAWVAPTLDIHARASFPLLQPAIGVGARAAWGRHEAETVPKWALTGALDLSLNPTYPAFFWGQERVAVAVWPMVGGQYLADSGFLARVEVGAILGFEDRSAGAHFGGGPDLRLAAGWAF